MRASRPDMPSPASQPPEIELPFDFIFMGKPKSLQADRSKLKAYKKFVHESAREYLPGDVSPMRGKLAVEVTHFYQGNSDGLQAPGNAVDVDNMLKPIVDALRGLIYIDDNQLVDVIGRKRWLGGAYHLRGMSSALATGFVANEEFVHVKICPPPDPARLP